MSRVVLFLLVFSFWVYGQNFRDTETYRRGYQMGEQGRQQWGGKNNLRGKLQDPASKGGDLVDIHGNRHRLEKGAVCQIADESTQRVVLEVTLSGTNNVAVRWSSNGISLDRNYSYSGRFLCLDPPSFCSELSPFTSSTNCTVLNISGGNISTSSSNTSPGGCYDTSQNMIVDTVSLARAFSSLLFNDYKSRGIVWEFYRIDESSDRNSSTAKVYAVQFKDCSGNPQVNRMSEYQKNPYKAREDALAFYLLCDPDDSDRNKAIACRTLRAMDAVGGLDKSTSTSRRTCSISRVVGNTVGRDDQLVCEPGTKVYFNGYNENKPWCVAGGNSSSFLNLHVSFWLECNKDGKGYTLKGWGYWEGSPCGSASYFPPSQVQVSYPVNIHTNASNVLVGKLSVNRRRGGEGISSGDRVTSFEAECVSEGSTPWNVYMDVNATSSYDINVRIPAIASLGSPWSSCANFSFTGELSLVGERFSGNCSGLEGCKLVNEWFVDASGRRYQVVKDGQVVSVYKQCRELVYNNLNKSYTSQSSSENCQGIPKTCKDVGGRIECRTWWRIDREYDCANTRTLPTVDTSTYAYTLNNTTYNPSSGLLSIPYRPGASCDSSGYCYPVSFPVSYYQCSVNNQRYEIQSLCVDNCYEQGTCSSVLEGYRCLYNSLGYTSEQQCLSACRGDAACQPVYYCPLNGNRYNDTNSCLSACGNCQERGSCSPVDYYRCSLSNLDYSSSASCQSACSQTGFCSQEYYCSEGSLSGQNCVTNPTCPLGSFNPQRNRCEIYPTCPSGFTWNVSRGRCEVNATCPSTGCEVSPSYQCVFTSASCRVGFFCFASGFEHNFSLDCYGNYCEGSKNSTTFYPVYISSSAYCYTSETIHRVTLMHTNSYYSGEASADGCSSGSITFRLSGGPSPYACATITRTAELRPVCPPDYTLSGDVCIGSCPSGSTYDSANRVCHVAGQCPAGSTYDATNGVCYASASCPFGTLQNGQCVRPAQIVYRCSINGQAYSDQISCQNACMRQGTCSLVQKYRCSLNGGEYDTQQQCSSSCVTNIQDCCGQRSYCPVDNRLYTDASQCFAQCVNQHGCQPINSYVCSFTSVRYSDRDECALRCKRPGQCSFGQETRQVYKCSSSGANYSDRESCDRSCSNNCYSERIVDVYTDAFNRDNACPGQSLYCIVRRPNPAGRPQYEMDTLECAKSGNSWTCPAGGAQIVENCKCGSELRQGFNYAVSVFGILDQALKDRSCEP